MIKRIHCNIDKRNYDKIVSIIKHNKDATQSKIVNTALNKLFTEPYFDNVEKKLEDIIGILNGINDEDYSEILYEVNNNLVLVYGSLIKVLEKF